MTEMAKEQRTLTITPKIRYMLLELFAERPADEVLKLKIMVPVGQAEKRTDYDELFLKACGIEPMEL